MSNPQIYHFLSPPSQLRRIAIDAVFYEAPELIYPDQSHPTIRIRRHAARKEHIAFLSGHLLKIRDSISPNTFRLYGISHGRYIGVLRNNPQSYRRYGLFHVVTRSFSPQQLGLRSTSGPVVGGCLGTGGGHLRKEIFSPRLRTQL